MHTRSRKIDAEASNGGKAWQRGRLTELLAVVCCHATNSCSQACEGPMSEVRECARHECSLPTPKDCQLGEWREWGACGKCNGQRFRSRNIIQYAEYGGLNCDEADTQEATSCPRQCHEPTYCVWSDWETWSRCSVRCGTGACLNAKSVCRVCCGCLHRKKFFPEEGSEAGGDGWKLRATNHGPWTFSLL